MVGEGRGEGRVKKVVKFASEKSDIYVTCIIVS